MTPPIQTIDSMPIPTTPTTTPAASEQHIDLSVLIPVYNEVDNVVPLHAELDAVLRPLAAGATS